MIPSQVATLALLDPDQGVCPEGHRCALARTSGRRACSVCSYVGMALICWGVTYEQLDLAERAGADPLVVSFGRSFLADRAS
jgi:hypothetical protein